MIALLMALAVCCETGHSRPVDERPRVAALIADWFPNSHPEVILGRILKTYTADGAGMPSQLRLVSVYRDKPSDRDLSADYARTNGFRIVDSVAEALTLGGKDLAVDGVILCTEWADYPVSATGQVMYPHRRLFADALSVMQQHGRIVPVFIDKHFADTWADAKWIQTAAAAVEMPLMAGSSLPVLWRRPTADVDSDRPLQEIVGISYHTLDGYGFHGLEMVQTLAEQRQGGETGIRSVQCLVDDAVWAAAGRIYDTELLAQALHRQPRQLPAGKTLAQVVPHPVLFTMDYVDGLRVNLLTLNGWANAWSAAWRYRDGPETAATRFETDERRFMHFADQLRGIESMFHTGVPAWPAARTLLTSGALDALLTSKLQNCTPLATPQLSFGYPNNWRWQPPAEPAFAYCQPTATTSPPDPVFDLAALLAPPLAARTLTRQVSEGIVTEEIMYHAEDDGAQSVDIFGIYCYPEDGEHLPAFIWNQSGGAQASPYFPLLGARRGYAALCIDLPMPGYRSTGGYPITSGLELGDDPHQAPIYHGAVALLRAVSFLQSRAEVDAERIGMAGSSWGGFFTTLMVGVDPRLKAGSAMFGCGGLQLGNAWWDGSNTARGPDDQAREHWRLTLDPAWRLARVRTPMAWFTGSNDSFYWMPALMQTFAAASGPKHLTLLPNWDHGLTPQIDDQVFAWLDTHLRGQAAFAAVTPLEVKLRNGMPTAVWRVRGMTPTIKAELMLSYGGDSNWSSRYWRSIPATIDGDACAVALPAAALPYYISGAVVEANGYRCSTPVIRVEPAACGLAAPIGLPDYNGCALWGGFDEAAIQYLRGLALMPNPEVVAMARPDNPALLVRQSVTLNGLYFTSGVPHRLSCRLKAQIRMPATLTVEHLVDGVATRDKADFVIDTEWSTAGIDCALRRQGQSERLTAELTLPPGATAWLDDVVLRPLPGPR